MILCHSALRHIPNLWTRGKNKNYIIYYGVLIIAMRAGQEKTNWGKRKIEKNVVEYEIM